MIVIAIMRVLVILHVIVLMHVVVLMLDIVLMAVLVVMHVLCYCALCVCSHAGSCSDALYYACSCAGVMRVLL